jgi:serine O-acetyltransferase
VLREDIQRVLCNLKGGKVRSLLVCFRTPGVKAVVTFRFGQWLLKQPWVIRLIFSPLYYILRYRVMTNWGIDIPREANIGAGLYIAHFSGIIISPEARIGKNLDISQGVTIGISGEGNKRGVPTIGDNVYIGPGAKLFGRITIGNNVKIGANVVVHKDIPDNSIVALKPGFEIISFESQRAQEIASRKNNS